MTKTLNLLPLISFFLIFFLFDKDFMAATAALMIGAALQITGYLLLSIKIPKSVSYSAIAIIILGGLTLILNDSLFVKIKPSIVLFLIAVFFAYEAIFTKGKHLNSLLYQGKSDNLNEFPLNMVLFSWLCCVGFTAMSIMNIALLNILSDEQWVYFKLIGIPVGTAVSLIIAFTAAALYKNKNTNDVVLESKNIS